MSQITKKSKTLYIVFSIISVLVMFAPLSYYFITGFMVAEVSYKFILSMSLVMSLLLTLVSIIGKFRLRCPVFILLLGIYSVLNSIVPLLIMLAIGTILDELLLTPLTKYYKQKYTINKEIDKRMV